MPTIRRYPGVAALDNKIYVTGGNDGHEDLSSVDCYDPKTNTWSLVANMMIARFGHCLLNLHGLLYARSVAGPSALQGSCDAQRSVDYP